MKNLKILTFSFVLLTLFFQSCSKENINDGDNDDTGEAFYSVTTKTIFSNLSENIAQSSGTETPTDLSKSLSFDFCFDFVYPITLKYNDDTTVNINSVQELLTIVETVNPTHYIDGIVFPFQVTSNGNTLTIANETDFAAILSNCDFDGDGIMNFLDTDCDNDGVPNTTEDLNHDGICTNDNTDNDSHPNYLDIDDDGDGVNTEDEDADHNGDCADDDSDGDGIPDYLDGDSDNDGIEDGDDPDADGDGINDDEEESECSDNDDD